MSHRLFTALTLVAASPLASAQGTALVSCTEQLTCAPAVAGDRYGTGVGYSDGRAIVGSRLAYGNGSACIWEEVGGTWTEVAQLRPLRPGGDDDGFGYVVAIDGDWALVGAPFEGAPGEIAPGGAYVYRRVAGEWKFFQALQTSGTTSADDRFGISVDISGDQLVVVAGADDTAAHNSGAAYVFAFDGTSWVLEDKVVSSNPQPMMRFGLGAAIDDGRLIVGAAFEDYPGFVNVGAAYIYERTPAGAWPLVQRIEAPAPSGAQFYGVSVSISGGTAVVGAEGVIVGGLANVGRAYVYERDPMGTWSLGTTLEPTVNSAGLTFGQQVSIDGDRILANARYDSQHVADAGRAYLFERVGLLGWSLTQELVSPNAASGDLFGQTIHVDGAVAIVGVPGDDSSGDMDAGAAYLFDLGISDCNGNGRADSCDIAEGLSTDYNGNGTPDECESLTGGPVASVYCSPAAANSAFSTGGRIDAIGQTMPALFDVYLIAADLPNNTFGYFLNSRAPGMMTMPGGSAGNLCLDLPIGRHDMNAQNTGTTNGFALQLDLNNLPRPTGMESVMAGERWYFQAWYRDNGVGASNFTEALWIQF